MKRNFFAPAVLLVSFCLSGCVETIQTVNNVAGLYNSGRAVTHGYYAYNMTKSIKDAEPLFENFDFINVEVLIRPRDKDGSGELISAFKDNFEYIVATDISTVELPSRFSVEKTNSEKTIVVQFKEDAYDDNLAQKIFIGDKLRGKLYFIELSNGKILKEESLEGVQSYDELLRGIHASVASKAIKSVKDKQKIEYYVNKINAINPIKPEYAALFKKS